MAALAAGCIGGKQASGPYKSQVQANAEAFDRLAFGLSRAEAAAVLGKQEIRPPWANDRGIGPQSLHNPFDSRKVEAPGGEIYEVDRYAVGLYGQAGCPFIRGEAVLEPLIFLDGKLVGWRWTYLASVLQRRLTAEDDRWSFGQFCNQQSEGPD
jgi:hypothetical protein